MSPPAMVTLFEKFWEWRLREFPEFATFCGFHQYDDRLDDVSMEGYQRKEKAAQVFLERCKALEMDASLSEEDKLSLTVLTEDLTMYTTGMKFKGYLFPINYMEGIQSDFEQLTSWMKFNSLDDYKKYVSRLEAIPQRVDQCIEALKNGVSQGVTLHNYSMQGVDESCSIHLKEVKETVFYEPFTRVPDNITNESIASTENSAVSVISDKVQPAIKKLKDYITQDYMKHLRPQEGISSIPGGDKFYAACLKYHLSVDMTPQEIHDIGLNEVARLWELMDEAMKQTGFDGSLKEFVEHLRNDEKFYFKDGDAVLAGIKDVCVNQIRPALPKLFKKIPESELIIEQVPPTRTNAPAGYYLAGTLDGSRPGKYFIHSSNVKMCPKYEMMTLSLHEGEPGHHFQGMYAIEQKGVPPFRQYLEDFNYFSAPSRFPIHTAYVEGWGLYCEYLGKELGLYEDPYTWFGHLSFNMHRACRLVVDTGIHAMGWTFEKAEKLLKENTALAEKFINLELRRYITWPGQACAYKIGEMKLKELRQNAADALGSKFSVHDYHEEVLKTGPVPLHVLESVVNRMIQKAKA